MPVQEMRDPVSQIVFRHLGQAAEEKAGPTHAAASMPNLKCACASGRARLISKRMGSVGRFFSGQHELRMRIGHASLLSHPPPLKTSALRAGGCFACNRSPLFKALAW